MSRDPKQVIKSARRVSEHGTSDDPAGIDGEDVYKAYEVGSTSQECLHIIRLTDTCHYPEYRYKMDVMHSLAPEKIMVVFSFMVVKIFGKHLEGLAEHLAHRDCISIQEYHPRQWPRPSAGAPIIEKIEVTLRHENDLTFETKASGTSH